MRPAQLLSLTPRIWVLLLGYLLLLVSCSPTSVEAMPKKLDVALKESPSFSSDIQPILNEYCVKCHQPQDAHGGLRLNSYQALMAGSAKGPILVPGKPEESLIIQAIKPEAPPSRRMPFHQEPLTPNRIRNIENWISLGTPDN